MMQCVAILTTALPLSLHWCLLAPRPSLTVQIKKGHFVTRDDAEPVFLHPSSVNHKRFSAAAGSGRQVWAFVA